MFISRRFKVEGDALINLCDNCNCFNQLFNILKNHKEIIKELIRNIIRMEKSIIYKLDKIWGCGYIDELDLNIDLTATIEEGGLGIYTEVGLINSNFMCCLTRYNTPSIMKFLKIFKGFKEDPYTFLNKQLITAHNGRRCNLLDLQLISSSVSWSGLKIIPYMEYMPINTTYMNGSVSGLLVIKVINDVFECKRYERHNIESVKTVIKSLTKFIDNLNIMYTNGSLYKGDTSHDQFKEDYEYILSFAISRQKEFLALYTKKSENNK
jgi:hypothetical protein